MSTIQQVICDQCGKLKGEANHWKYLYIAGGDFSSTCIPDSAYYDFCGEACLLKRISELIAEPPAVRECSLEGDEHFPNLH